MNQTQTDLEAAFVNVRRAYRLLHAYQMRVNELLREIDAVMASRGLEFVRWWPKHFSPPAKRGTKYYETGRWAWDFFPGYSTAVRWWGRVKGAGPTLQFGVDVVSDSGFCKSGAEPDSESFPSPETCWTGMKLGLRTSTAPRPDFANTWVKHLEQENLFDGKIHEITVDEHVYTYQYLGELSFFELGTPEEVKRNLLEPLEQSLDGKPWEGFGRM